VVLKLLGALACKPLAAANFTSAVLYRVVEAYSPTILLLRSCETIID
jgi:hypothetical protein